MVVYVSFPTHMTEPAGDCARQRLNRLVLSVLLGKS
jgi:hypothetical protein